jgi:hypothetical protein
MDPLTAASTQKVSHHPSAMNTGAIPNDQQFARDLAQELLEKDHNLLTANRIVVDFQEQPPCRSHPNNHMQLRITTRNSQNGWFSNWCPGSHQCRKEGKARFVYPDDCPFFVFGFFLISGQVSSRQCSMAESLRWLARSIGFWKLQPIRRRRRPIWSWW